MNTCSCILHKFLPNRYNWFGWVALCLTILIAFLWQINTPADTDDFYYKFIPDNSPQAYPWFYLDQKIDSFALVPRALIGHWLQLNGRLANLVFVVLQPLPLWFIKGICGLGIAFFIVALWLCTGRVKLSDSRIAVLLPIMVWTGLQWENQMQSSDFQFNYTFSSILFLISLWCFFFSDRPVRWWGWTCLALCSLWHEGFAIVLGFFLGTQWLFKPGRKIFIALLILICGVAITNLSPGMQLRSENTLSFWKTYHT